MAYQEQIGVENRRWRERRTRMHPLRRVIQDVVFTAAITVAGLALWALSLAPIIAIFR